MSGCPELDWKMRRAGPPEGNEHGYKRVTHTILVVVECSVPSLWWWTYKIPHMIKLHRTKCRDTQKNTSQTE